MSHRYPNEYMESLRQIGDPELDAIMRELIGGQQLGAVNEILRAAQTNGSASRTALPASLASWLASHARLPEGVDRARIDRASAFFVDHGISISALLGLASLPECYVARRGVKALHATDQMGYSGTEKRVSETSQFVLHVMIPGELFENGKAIATLMKVRMMHSASRILIAERDWDVEGDGVPINQEDLIGTLTTFGYSPLVHIKKLGVAVTEEQAEDYWYFWRVAGELLGIDPGAIPIDVKEAALYFARIMERHLGKSNEGIELTRALLDVYGRLIPGLSFMPGLVPGVIRYLAGDAVADALEIPESKWAGALEKNRLFFRLINAVQERSTLINGFINRMGLRILDAQAVKIGGGKRAEFVIPTELRRAWRLPPHGSSAAIAEVTRELADALHSQLVAAETTGDLAIDVSILIANADGEIDPLEELLLIESVQRCESIDEGEALRRIRRGAARLRKRGARAIADLGSLAVKLSVAKPVLRLAIAIAYANSGIAKAERDTIERLAAEMKLESGDLEEELRAVYARIQEVVRRLSPLDGGAVKS